MQWCYLYHWHRSYSRSLCLLNVSSQTMFWTITSDYATPVNIQYKNAALFFAVFYSAKKWSNWWVQIVKPKLDKTTKSFNWKFQRTNLYSLKPSAKLMECKNEKEPFLLASMKQHHCKDLEQVNASERFLILAYILVTLDSSPCRCTCLNRI